MPMPLTPRSPLSKTAEAAAVGRAIEHRRRGEDRIVDDPLAQYLVHPAWRAMIELLSLPGIGPAMLAGHDRRLPGVLGNLLCRTRYFDEQVLRAISEGIEQIVILGSGLDSRAYRLADMRHTQVFEVDRRAMLVWKEQRLRRVLDTIPSHVQAVECDLLEGNLDKVMEKSQLRRNLRTFFIWEGVSQYLTAEAVDAVVRFVANTEPGSRVAFTYIDRDVTNAPDRRSDEDHRVISFIVNAGESWTFGFAPSELPAYLSARGLRTLEHIGATEYRTKFLDPLGRKMRLYQKEFAVVAEVA